MTRRNRSRKRTDPNRDIVRLKTQRAARRDSRQDTLGIGARRCPFALGASCPGDDPCAFCVDIPNHIGSQHDRVVS